MAALIMKPRWYYSVRIKTVKAPHNGMIFEYSSINLLVVQSKASVRVALKKFKLYIAYNEQTELKSKTFI